MTNSLACFLTVCLAALPLGAAPQRALVGYRGDGTGVHPHSMPPVQWDDQTGRNILWKVPLPNWGHACPTVINGRVFILCEPGWTTDWPYVLCLDEKDGRELWRRELNHLPSLDLDEQERQRIEQTWRRLNATYRHAYTLFNGWTYARSDDEKMDWEDKFDAAGLDFGGWSGGGYGQLRRMKFKDRTAHEADRKLIERGGLSLETWYHDCGMAVHCVGQVFTTPLSDGKYLYVAVGWHSYACLDMEGNIRWIRSYRGDGCYGSNDYCKNARQPLLYGDLFLADAGAVLRAMDRSTGELRWSARVRPLPAKKVKPGHLSILSPLIITTGGTDVLICGGAGAEDARADDGDEAPGGSMLAFSLPEGRAIPVEGWYNPGLWAVVKHDEPDVVFFTGGGEHGGWSKEDMQGRLPSPAAVKFTLVDGKLRGQVLWSGIEGRFTRQQASLLYHDQKLYLADGFILDARTGKIIAGPKPDARRDEGRATPPTRHLLELANGHIYGLKEGPGKEQEPAQAGIMSVYALDGRKVAESVMHNAPVQGEKKRQITEVNGWNTWDFSYACPFTISGDRIYIRSYDYLWCIGAREGAP